MNLSYKNVKRMSSVTLAVVHACILHAQYLYAIQFAIYLDPHPLANNIHFQKDNYLR